jgi:hypothetical protein
MNKVTKVLLAILAIVVAIVVVVLITPQVVKPIAYTLEGAGTQQGRLLQVQTGDIAVCANGAAPDVTYVVVRGQAGLMFDCGADVTPTPSATAPVTATATAVMVTITPTLTITPTGEAPTPTATASPTPTSPPTSSLPLCEEHNDIQYHGLVSEDGRCHYDHTHFGDPTQLDWLAEQTDSPWPLENWISYPHQTPHENEMKHTGNVFTVNSTASDITASDFECVQFRDPPNIDGCVIAWRIHTHTIGGARALLTRIHSIYGQVFVQNPDGTIGSISTGGWVDWGHLMAPYKQQLIPTAQDGPFELAGIFYDAVSTNLGQPPYRAGEPQITDGQPGRYAAQWNMCSNQTGAHTHAICLDFVSFRDFGGVDVDAPSNIWLACPDLTCDNNHSNIRPYEVRATTPPELGDGLINFNGWTDLHGNIVDESECVVNEFGIFPCAPLVINNVQAGTYLFRIDLGTNAGPNGPQDRWQEEYDTSPAGESWIKYPYR